jgi:hypothetical protein
MWYLLSELQLSALHRSYFGKKARELFLFLLNVILWFNVLFEAYH